MQSTFNIPPDCQESDQPEDIMQIPVTQNYNLTPNTQIIEKAPMFKQTIQAKPVNQFTQQQVPIPIESFNPLSQQNPQNQAYWSHFYPPQQKFLYDTISPSDGSFPPPPNFYQQDPNQYYFQPQPDYNQQQLDNQPVIQQQILQYPPDKLLPVVLQQQQVVLQQQQLRQHQLDQVIIQHPQHQQTIDRPPIHHLDADIDPYADQGCSYADNMRIYINNSKGYNKLDLKQICETFGQVSDFLFRDEFAFAEYRTREEANQVLAYLKSLNITAEYSKPKQNRDNTREYLMIQPRIYIRGLNNYITEKQIRLAFQEYGEIVDVLLKDDFAFIEYRFPVQAQRALKTMNGAIFNGNKIIIEAARPRGAGSTSEKLTNARLYIGHISPQTNKEDLYTLFSRFGKIIDFVLQREYAFVEYDNIYSASEAIGHLNNTTVRGTRISVEESKPRGMKERRETKKRKSRSRSRDKRLPVIKMPTYQTILPSIVQQTKPDIQILKNGNYYDPLQYI